MKITLLDGSQKEYQEAKSGYDIALDISEGLARNAVAIKVNGELKDLYSLVDEDAEFSVVTLKDKEGLDIYRHTCSHILAQAVKSIYPNVKLAIGPTIVDGFYYDFDFKTPISKDDFDKIEAEMNKIIKAKLPLERHELSKKDAVKLFSEKHEDYKVELINDLPKDSVISTYKQGDFVDLCRGPHLPNTGLIKAFKLTSIAGAYWRGSEKNKMLTRIYATAFGKKSELEEYLTRVEEAKLRDHNKIGRELGYFMTDENIGQGLPLLMPKGARVVQLLQRFVEDEEERRGYVLTKTPFMAKSDLYKISGHWDHYKDGMFIIGDEEKDDEVLAMRPMTCPFQYTIYNNGIKSYRDLPIRYGETSTLFRKEASGEMHGLIRVRQFTISEGHLVCTPEQLEKEFAGVVNLIKFMMKAIGFENDVTYRFSRWDPEDTDKYINEPKTWEKAEATMEKILKHLEIPYTEAKGEAAFYGPKLDIQYKNVYGKEDTIITVQVDMFLAENFDMTYIDEKGVKQRPYIIHRTSLGCYERTLAYLIEKYAGAIPLWIAPTQIKVLSLTEKTVDDAIELTAKLQQKGFRVECDVRNEKIGYKIREAQLEKVPYMIVLGQKEIENKVIAVRSRKGGDLGTMTESEFIKMVRKQVEARDNTI
ncbi:MAG: threonine--tRNA ligase [Eubacteriales bacterium]|nr:threonine--tRNA ligase [Eubacteriales bacterium]MDY5439449.1 threonine--tRNA ligase [Eubacteriales bacterium]